MKFGILEIGSTNTKVYIYDDGKIIDYNRKYIPFKTSYKNCHSLFEMVDELNGLYDLINELQEKVTTIYAFGTSIFRQIPKEELNDFTQILRNNYNIIFKMVTADEESEYTVKGVINNIDLNSKLAVVIGGGGSTELAIIENKTITKKYNFNFGAMDITEKFNDLKDDIASSSFEEILEYTSSLIGKLNEQVNILILAGGDYIYFYESVNYEMQSNTLYEDNNQPYMLDINTANKYDKDILNTSLNEIKTKHSDNAGWWDGARGMRFCIHAIAKELNVKYIVPTRINMLIGLINEIKKSLND